MLEIGLSSVFKAFDGSDIDVLAVSDDWRKHTLIQCCQHSCNYLINARYR
jgi:hypothetical protein